MSSKPRTRDPLQPASSSTHAAGQGWTVAAGGTRLCGRYRLERLLGTGGMASVWLARDETLDRPVAVKLIADTLAADPLWVRRFEREARAAAALNHPNVVSVHDFGEHRGRPFLVMQYVAGGSLLDRDAGSPPLDPERLARELLAGLAHIHAAGIVHRDIKPANVMLEDGTRARITDFGVARREDASQLTKVGLVVGTARFLAPEVLAGGDAGPAADLYACGRLLEDVLGERPAGRLAPLLAALTAERPEQRPASAAAAIELIGSPRRRARPPLRAARPPATEETAQTRPVDAPAGATPPGRHWAMVARRTHPRAGTAVAAALVCILVAIALLASMDGGAHRSPPVAPPAPAAAAAPLGQQISATLLRLGYAARHR